MSNDKENPQAPHVSLFESIRKVSDEGSEYWLARDLAKVLSYTRYDKFGNAVQKAEVACLKSGQPVENHMSHVRRMVQVGSGAQREVDDIELSRYACYLIVMNADPSKKIVALGQTYFAVQVRRQEQADALADMSEDQKRLYLRNQIYDHNRQLAEAAGEAGIVKAFDFAIFQDHGYMGLYGGMRAKEIHTNKSLKKSQQILDHMGSDELAANIFRASQTKQKLQREQIKGKEVANQTHYEVGKEVRETIKRLGGDMPETLPTPAESIQQLRQKEKKRLKQGPQLSLFDEPSQETEE